uniref:Uncharacterized protein n=1 Tax=Strongyloides venezuelensis TaxID=75913 RepID=A0A0K0G5C2_STRVS
MLELSCKMRYLDFSECNLKIGAEGECIVRPHFDLYLDFSECNLKIGAEGEWLLEETAEQEILQMEDIIVRIRLIGSIVVPTVCILISLDAIEEDGFKGMLRKSPFHCTRKLHLSSFSLHNVDIHRDLQRPINLKSDPREYTEME